METITRTDGLRDLFGLLVRAQMAVWDRVDARLRAAHGVTLARFEVMACLAARPGAQVTEVAGALGITLGGASKVIGRVEGAGHLTRAMHPDDGRRIMLRLTPVGARVQAAAQRTVDEELDAVFSNFGEDRRAQLHLDLAALREATRATPVLPARSA